MCVNNINSCRKGNDMKEMLQVGVNGRVKIFDADTKELILDKCNAIHPQHCALIIAKALSRDITTSPGIFSLNFGNGGTFYNSSNQLVYRPPNTVGAATLYNQTYSVQVDDQAVGTPPTNSVTAAPATSPSINSIVTITAQLNANEPSGQAVADNITTNPDAPYMFDEIGLKSSDGLLLSHVITSPIEKTANRAFFIIYTLTISIS
jgi:hypothetical protein